MSDCALSVRMRPVALLLASLACRAPVAACPAPSAPWVVAQQAGVAGAGELRALEAPGTRRLASLVLLGRSCRVALSVVYGRISRYERGAVPFPRKLRFQVVEIPGLPQPLVIGTAATVGGSDTEFETQLIGPVHGSYQVLLPAPLRSLIEGGFFVGDLGKGIGPGVAVWDFIWGDGEAHVSPHRYELQRLRWTTFGFRRMPTLRTRLKYDSAEQALRELGLAYPDMTRDFADYDAYR